MVLPVEENARFPMARLRPLEARKYDWIVHRRVVRVKLFGPFHLLAECPARGKMGEKRGVRTVLDAAPSCARHLVSQMEACRQCSR